MLRFVSKYRNKSLKYLFVAALALLVPASHAAEVEVIGSGMIITEVPPFSGPEGMSAMRVFSDDLKRTLLIDPAGNSGSKYGVTASLSGTGLTGKLVDRIRNTELLNKTYAGDWRSSAHAFADDVTEALTGAPGFSRSKVAFISSSTGAKELYTMDIDGSSIKRLTTDKTISASPAWNKDVSEIAYMSYKSGYPDVYVIKLAQGLRTRVAGFPGINSGPSYSPDGKTLALTLSKDGNPEIYTMPAAGGAMPKRLTRTRGTETSPSWSPDGSRIVFTSDDRGSVQLFIMDANGGDAERLPLQSGYSSEPDWSPDGKKIAYTARVGGAFQIWVYDVILRKSVMISAGEDPSWTRNSRHLICSNGGALTLVDTVSKRSQKLENGLSNCTEPAISRY